MQIRTFTVAAVAALAVGAPVAQGQVLGAGHNSSSTAASHMTAAAVRALGHRYQAMANAYNERRSGIAGSGNPVPTYPSSVLPNDRAGVLGIGETPVSVGVVPTSVIAQPKANPFSWGAAGLGAGAALLLAAALIGGVRLSHITRNAQRSLRTS